MPLPFKFFPSSSPSQKWTVVYSLIWHMPLSLEIFCSYYINCRISINWAKYRQLVQWNGTVYYCECYLCIYLVHSCPSLFPPPPFLTPSYSQGHVSPSYTASIQPLHPLPTYTENFCFAHQLVLSSLWHDRRMQTLIMTSYAFVYLSLFLHPSGSLGKWRRSKFLTSSSFFCTVAVPIPSPIII